MKVTQMIDRYVARVIEEAERSVKRQLLGPGSAGYRRDNRHNGVDEQMDNEEPDEEEDSRSTRTSSTRSSSSSDNEVEDDAMAEIEHARERTI